MSEPLLQPGDPPAVRVVNATGRAPLLLVCDHASDAIPCRLGALGVGARDLERHIAYDIGAQAVAEILAARFDAPLVLSGFSRLVIDCNRTLDDPTSIPPVSDAVPIPGNQNLSPEDRRARVDALFEPYHRAIADRLAVCAPVFFSVHSCTPVLAGYSRPWHVGVLWNRDDRVAAPLMTALARDRSLCVGDNEPYSGRDGHGYTIPVHAEARGLAHVMIEIRQDLIEDAAGIARWAQITGDAFAPILTDLTGWTAP